MNFPIYERPWDKNLNTEIKWIDDQHKNLLEKIGDLLKAINKGKGKDELFQLIKFLDDYNKYHFSAEEKYMLEYDYPHIFDHLNKHQQFQDMLHDKVEQYSKEGSSDMLVYIFKEILWEWYKEHICNDDRKLAVFLKLKKAK